MSDNVTTPVSGQTFATDDVAGVQYQRVKITDGTADAGTNHLIVDSAGAAKVNQRVSTTAAQSNVSGSASSVTLLASNSSRIGAYFFNDSTSACYISLAATASTTAFCVKLAAAGAWEPPMPGYTGQITCIWDSATGAMRVTELT